MNDVNKRESAIVFTSQTLSLAINLYNASPSENITLTLPIAESGNGICITHMGKSSATVTIQGSFIDNQPIHLSRGETANLSCMGGLWFLI